MKRTFLETTLYVMIGLVSAVIIFSFSACTTVKPEAVEAKPKPELTELIIASDSIMFDGQKRAERTIWQFKKNTLIHTDQLQDYYFQIKEREADGAFRVLCECNQKEYKLVLNQSPGWSMALIHPERTIYFHLLTVTKKPW